MQLREVYIRGFKSFADGVRLRFEGGVTGVVGPNGCGKSNFVDAMRWVLGEQRARVLRAERMHQLIFNGTRSRKSLNLAEVSLSLEQTKNVLPTHHQHLQITRRIYRSGESEYAINGVPARLKDITDLMLDSGMSAEAYSIIELKMIEDILSNKEAARRHLFEHAAGIAKFKAQRKEALQRLQHAEADLKRIADLMHELEQNLGTLERQAKRALKYKDVQKRYALMRSLQVARSSQQLEGQKQSLSKQLHQEEERTRTLHRQLHRLEASYTSEQKGYEEQEKALQRRQRLFSEAQQQYQSLRQSLALSESQSLQLSDRGDELRRSIEQQKKQQDEGAARVKGLEEELRAAGVMSEEARRMLASAHAAQKDRQQALEDASSASEKVGKELSATEAHLQHLRHQKQLKEAYLQQLTQQLKALEEALSELQSSRSTLKEQQRALRLRIEEASAQVDELQKSEQATYERISTQQRSNEETRVSLQAVRQKIQQQEDQISWIQETRDKMEGYPVSIRWLRKEQGYSAPLLMEVFELNPTYVDALTVYLAPVAQYFIVERRAEAEATIELLSHAEKGQASFFILDEVSELRQSLGEKEGAQGLVSARAQVRCAAIYDRLCDWLLEGVYVSSKAYSSEMKRPRAIVSAEGTWVYEVAVLRGGHRGIALPSDAWGLKERQEATLRVLEGLKQEAITLEERLAEDEEALSKMQQGSSRVERKAEEARLQQLAQEEAAYLATEAEYARNSEHHQKTRARLQSELQDTEAALCELEEEIGGLSSAQKQVDQARASAISALEEARRAHEAARDEAHSLQLQYTQKQSQYERLKAEYELHNNYLKVGAQQLSEDQEALNDILLQQQELKKEHEQLEASILEAKATQDKRNQEVQDLERTYYKQRDSLSGQEQQLRALEKQHTHAQLLQSELQGQFTQVSEELRHVLENFRTEIGSDLEELYIEAEKEAQKEQISPSDAEAIDRSVEELKSQLQSMGTVNPLAAESFKEMKERHSFVGKEQEDLLNAESSIRSSLTEIEKTVDKRFSDAFSSINTHFQEVFRTLFSEDDVCRLELSGVEGSDEQDVEIIAQPKGKRPMRIEQLSGGEKALTAIALLVAIYLHKPSPFCILDEVDAPLDDANSDKFNQLIRKLSDRAQFILITHNKRTMRGSDLLYGFTMPEVGVSRVLPVDLRALSSSS